jgi:Homeodomain-like domain
MQTTAVPLRPAVLRAAREIGITDAQIAEALGVGRGTLGNWVALNNPMPPETVVALVTVVAALRERLAKQQLRLGVRQAKIRDATLESAQRWLDVAAEEIEGFDADAIWAGGWGSSC